ncbi:MAG: cadmium-translocating P-type ATPase [Clostridia bacterium]|nr:cadmium-translocating P-type ATPase [Clostridia bacterium]
MTKSQKRMLILIGVAAALFAGAFFVPVAGVWRALVFAVPYLTVGLPVLKKAFLSVIHGQMMDENFLMAVASLGAFALGEYPEGVAVMLFSRLGELFESYAVGKSRASVAELMTLCPDEATVLREGEWVTVFPEEISVGETVRVLPGEKVPLDGTVLSGTSSLDTRSLTGESLPRDVGEGDSVLSGCVNLSGVLTLRAEKEFGESTASKILALVEDASSHRSTSESFVSAFARRYTPIVLICAAVVALIPPLFLGNWGEWIHRALSFLVISCPCALVISVPLTYFGGIGGASRQGILVKGSDRLEQLAKVDTVVFDKTGTLTLGVFEVSRVEGEDPDRVLSIAARCESFSNHPIAQSLRAACPHCTEEGVGEFEEMAGYGISACVDGVRYYVGNEALMHRQGVVPFPTDGVGTRIYVSDGSVCLGVITVSDRVKDNAASAVRALRAEGVGQTVMLTGDGEAVANAVAAQVGLDRVRAGLLPADKVDAMKEILSQKKGCVAYVGDGMNDAPVLAASDVGIAMGGIGSDAAIEAADVVLMYDNPEDLPRALRLARKIHRIVVQNIVFSIGVKVLVLILSALGFSNMWHAVFADVGVSVIAILNAMRTLSKKA